MDYGALTKASPHDYKILFKVFLGVGGIGGHLSQPELTKTSATNRSLGWCQPLAGQDRGFPGTWCRSGSFRMFRIWDLAGLQVAATGCEEGCLGAATLTCCVELWAFCVLCGSGWPVPNNSGGDLRLHTEARLAEWEGLQAAVWRSPLRLLIAEVLLDILGYMSC